MKTRQPNSREKNKAVKKIIIFLMDENITEASLLAKIQKLKPEDIFHCLVKRNIPNAYHLASSLRSDEIVNKLEYLYGVKCATWKHLNYLDAFELKNKLANNVLSEINETHYLFRDDKRKREVIRAIEYNRQRIEE